jgi:hypothetical protein
MAINQLSTANTFQQWLIATQSLIEKSNFFEDTANLVFETANNTSNTANLVFANAAVVNAQTALVLTTASNVYATASNVYATYANTIIVAGFVNSNLTIALNTANSITSNALNTSNSITSAALNTANIIVNSANSFANTVNVTAQAAFNTANAAFAQSSNAANLIYEVLDDTSTDTTLFVALFDANTGTPNTAYVSSSKLYYNPSSGELSATNFDSLSDVNKKTDIETIQNAIETVGELRGVTFKWKDNGHKSMGLIAQEVEAVVPEVVVTNELGDKSVTYGSLIGLLVEAVKDLNDQVAEIKDIINKK